MVLLLSPFRKHPSPEETERERRAALVKHGRIIDATVSTSPTLRPKRAGGRRRMHLILYQYEIAGVVYECSQDVTLLSTW